MRSPQPMSKILVIEDNPTILDNLQELLEAEGYEASVALGGEEGVRLAQYEHPDLILCDMKMPGKDGIEVLSELRSYRETTLIPFVFLTGHADKESWRHGMDLGADDYLVKPFTRAELLSAVEARLERSRLAKELLCNEKERRGQRILETVPGRVGNLLNQVMGIFALLSEEDDPRERIALADVGQKATVELCAIWQTR